jgi:hypothetical protein
MTISLKEARDQGKLNQFVKEQEAVEKTDGKAFNHTLKAMARTSPKAPKASSRNNPDD